MVYTLDREYPQNERELRRRRVASAIGEGRQAAKMTRLDGFRFPSGKVRLRLREIVYNREDMCRRLQKTAGW